jgi:glucokinase
MTIEPDTEQKQARGAYSDGPRLLADIGATHARFALESAPGVLRNVVVLLCDDYAGIVPLLNAYLAQTGGIRISHAAFALANPISGDFSSRPTRCAAPSA